MSKTKKVFIAVSVIFIIAIFICGAIININKYKVYAVDGPSMAPTLPAGQHILTTGKVASLKRYDVIIYNRVDSQEFGTSAPKKLIKRIVALPGERITIKDNKILVFNSGNPSGFDPDAGQTYLAAGTQTPGTIDEAVPQGSYFVLGDNRTASLDSRMYGPIKQSDILSKEVRKWY